MRPPFLDNNTKSKPRIRSKSFSRPRSRPKTTASRAKNSPPRRRIHADTSSPKPKPGILSLVIRYTSIILILMLGTGMLLYIKQDEWGVTTFIQNYLPQENEPKPKPDPAKYASLKAQLEANRRLFKMLYLGASTPTEQQRIIKEAGTLLEESLPPMMRCWLGHPYDFNGTATIPGEGKIACGYFVSVIMRDAGFKINRIRLAQQPSQNIIRTFVSHRNFYEVKTNTPYPEYIDDINKRYEGIHIVGLDTHVAFIVIKDGEMRYIHSSGGREQCVVDEGINNAVSLKNSNYRVISNISRNPDVIKKWILGESFPTVVSQ